MSKIASVCHIRYANGEKAKLGIHTKSNKGLLKVYMYDTKSNPYSLKALQPRFSTKQRFVIILENQRP